MRKVGTFKIHPICDEVPGPSPEDRAAMVESIKARGINHAVLIWGGAVVSGKTRVEIGTELGISIPTRNWNPTGKGAEAVDREIRELLLDEDFNRRHLKAGQRAMFVAPLVNTENGRPEKGSKIRPFSKEAAAEKAGVSEQTMADALTVDARGSEVLKEAVREGEVAPSDAAKVASLPKSEQNAAVKAVKSGEAKTVAKAAGVTKPREPGDDKTEARHRQPRTKPEGNGKLEFDDTMIEGHFGKLIRAIDDRARALKCKDGQRHKSCLKHLNAFCDEFVAWQKERK